MRKAAAVAMLSVLLGGCWLFREPPPPPVLPPPAIPVSPPAAPVEAEDAVMPLCHLEGGTLRYVPVRIRASTGEATYQGLPFPASYRTAEYAAEKPWYLNGTPIRVGAVTYRPQPGTQVIQPERLNRVTTHLGVPLFALAAQPHPNGTSGVHPPGASLPSIFVPVAPECVFRRYNR